MVADGRELIVTAWWVSMFPGIGIMLTVTVLIDGVVLLAYAHLAARGARALEGSRLVAWLERAFGAALIFFGIRLALSQK